MNQNQNDLAGKAISAILVDAHVHIHECFKLSDFLDAAAKNFSNAASNLGISDRYVSVLCLTETSYADKFGELRALAENNPAASVAQGSAWRARTNDEAESLSVNHPRLGRIHIVAGKQIVVAERLEVLALGCASSWPDGLPASEVVEGVIEAGGIAVLPWGFGKWLGRRGRTIRCLIENYSSQSLFLGDNSGRPIFFREPSEFQLGRELGLKILPGTDPLPFASESNRAGSFGFFIDVTLDDRAPWYDLSRQLVQPSLNIKCYGRLESTFRFVRNQLAMQYVIRTGGGRI